MILFAALVPPREILDDLWSVVDSRTEEATDEATEPPPSRRRASRRRSATANTPKPAPLDVAPVAHVALTMAKFGNLALLDANRLRDALTRAATEWSSPRLRLAGYSTLEAEVDPSVWVDLNGDLDALHAVTKGVHEVAARLSLFVDRRLFVPSVRLGSVSPHASEPELEAVLARLAAFETNAWWQTRFSLLTKVEHGFDEPSFKVFAEIPLGPHVVH